MSRSDLYAVEPCGHSLRSIRLPIHVEPRAGEAFNSWIIRLGSRLGLYPADTMHCAFGIDIANRPEWWRRPELGELTAIANRTGLAVECIQSMTLAGWTQERADERHERFEAAGFQRQQISPATRRPTPICGLCLEEAVVPFLRLEWMIGWVAVCPDHRTALITHCPACYTRLTQSSQITGREVALDRCQRCDFQISGLAGTPAQDSVCRLQTQLMALKRTGSGNLPEQGRMTWPEMIGLIDLILAAVWSIDARHSASDCSIRYLRTAGSPMPTGWACAGRGRVAEHP